MKIEESKVGSILGKEEIDAIAEVINSGESLTRGKQIEEFEREFAKYCNSKYAVALSSCGGALHIARQILELDEDDEVIVQGNAFWITINQLVKHNVKIKVCDIENDTLNIDVNCMENLITDKTKAIYVMHHGGNPANIDKIRKIAKSYNLTVVEDAAHALGAEWKGKRIGYNSDIACFSLSTLKNITTLGEGGMIVTNDIEVYEKALAYRTGYPIGVKVKREPSFGNYNKPDNNRFMRCGDYFDVDYKSVVDVGTTFRMTTPQAAVGLVQLKKLDNLLDIRKYISNRYNKVIEEKNGITPLKVEDGCRNTWHLYNCFLDENLYNRDMIIDQLEKGCKIFSINRFPPINLWGVMRMRGHKLGECPNCEKIWFEKQLSLPINPKLKECEIEYVCKSLDLVI